MREGVTPWQALVAGHPLEDIHQVRRLQLVIKDGRIVSDKQQKAHR